MHRSFPPFRPHALLRSGHAQTLAGAYLPSRGYRYGASQHYVTLDDGDQVVLHDDLPPQWQPGDRAALLIHGLAGCHESGYMQRIAYKLAARGVRAFRMDLRGCGAGQRLARLPYHSGRSEDAAAALVAIARLAPDSPVTLVGFSLGGNITLKLLGELGDRPCGHLDSAMAVCPPVDLAACSRQIQKRPNQLYDRYFVRLLIRQVESRGQLLSGAAVMPQGSVPRTLWDFDNTYTSIVCGFGTADGYYRQASSLPLLGGIRLPTLILASRDDPMIPPDALLRTRLPAAVRLLMTDSGGHLGFVGRRGVDADRRWMDWRVVDWVLSPGRAATKKSIVIST
ncbi:MAG: alpha/beta fold hydrolase [Planctomycetota bacterium]|nr:MAG: alpha/beta fold hydrolase [Planctomycetota bacterium]